MARDFLNPLGPKPHIFIVVITSSWLAHVLHACILVCLDMVADEEKIVGIEL
jgi:hypothetical protein